MSDSQQLKGQNNLCGCWLSWRSVPYNPAPCKLAAHYELRSAPYTHLAQRRLLRQRQQPQFIRLEAALLTFSQVIIAELVHRSAINLPSPTHCNYHRAACTRRRGEEKVERAEEGVRMARERQPGGAALARGLKCTMGTRL